MATPTEPLLTLSTLVDHERIVIDEVSYNLRNLDELSVVDAARAAQIGKRLQALAPRLSDLSDDVAIALDRDVETIVRMVLDAPNEVHAKLTFQHRFAVAKAFMSRRAASRTGTGATPVSSARRPTGSRSSRGSSASTGSRRRTG